MRLDQKRRRKPKLRHCGDHDTLFPGHAKKIRKKLPTSSIAKGKKLKNSLSKT